MIIKYFNKEEFERDNKNLVLVEDFGSADVESPKLYLNNDDGHYYARGYWSGPKYNFLRYAKIDFIDVDTWIKNMRNTLSKK